MQLKGYIKAFKENSFTIPVYGDNNFYYYHSLDDDFKIIAFNKTEITPHYFKKTYLSQTFIIGSIGAIAFVGDESLISCNQADKNIDEIINYLNDTTPSSKYLNIKREALELRQILFKNISDEMVLFNLNDTIKTIEVKDYLNYENLDMYNNESAIIYTLGEYIKEENYLTSNNQVYNFKENIIKKYIEKLVFDKTLFDTNKEVMFSLFIKYLDNNKSAFEEIIFNSNIGNDFSSYLSSTNEVMISPLEITIEETLRERAEQRRNTFKTFNYCFNNSVSNIEELTKIPAYKRAGIELDELPNSNPKFSKVIVSVESKDLNKVQSDLDKVHS